MNKSRIFLIPIVAMGLSTFSGCGKTKTFTVYWKNYDGTLLEKDENVPKGSTPKYDGAEPERDWDTNIKYFFSGWDKQISPVESDVTYTATYSSKPRLYFDVYWKNYDGSILEIDKAVEEGTTPTYNGATPTRQKTDESIFTFKGWDKVVGPISGETVYIATYSDAARPYKITFLNYDNTLLEEKMVGYGTIPEYSGEAPTRPSTLTTDYEWSGGWDRDLKPVDGNMVYKATFTETVYDTVKIIYQFPTLKHEIVNNNVTKVRENTSVELSEPTCKGYDFKGFFLDPEYKKQVSNLPNLEIDVKLYGKFELHTYNVTYVLQGGTSEANPAKINCEQTVSLNSPTKTGYQFQAWKDNKGKTYTKLEDVCEDLTLTATYIANSYQIILVYAESNNKVVSIKYNQDIILEQPSKNGYEFLGWYYLEDPEVKFDLKKYTLLNDVMLVPKFSEAIQYTISYQLEGGTNPENAPKTYSDIDHPELPVPTRDGYDFGGWLYNNKEFKSFVNIYTNVTLKATWIPHDVHITFNYDGGSLQRHVTFKDGDKVESNVSVSPFESAEYLVLQDKDDAQFNGWTNSSGKYESFAADSTINKDITLKAAWSTLEAKAVGGHIGEDKVFNVNGFNYQSYQFTPLVDQTVTFYSEGTCDVKASLHIKGQDKDVLAASDDISDSNLNFSFAYKLKAYTSYVLKVESNIEGEGEVVIKTSTDVEVQKPSGKIFGDDYKIPSMTQKYNETFKGIADPVKEGKTFGGWIDENGNPFAAGATFDRENITLTAKWVD